MEGRGLYNITLALLQSILVSLLAYVLIAISENDILKKYSVCLEVQLN